MPGGMIVHVPEGEVFEAPHANVANTIDRTRKRPSRRIRAVLIPLLST
jgi:hypothetical protein